MADFSTQAFAGADNGRRHIDGVMTHFSTDSDSVRVDTDRTDRPAAGIEGYCRSCASVHRLAMRPADDDCRALMAELERHRRLDFDRPAGTGSPWSTASLFGPARGKMFGVLRGIDRHGEIVLLRAFSGQFNGCWNIPGWAPPLFEEGQWRRVHDATEGRIKEITRLLRRAEVPPQDMVHQARHRKRLSQGLMRDLHQLYAVSNFAGERRPLQAFFPGGIPTGTGDCCAPKLLNQAVLLRITPIAMAEFYWGLANRSATRQHERFYLPCPDKCGPLLGFMLCGLESSAEAARRT